MKSVLGWVRADGDGEMDQGVKTGHKEMVEVPCMKGKQTGLVKGGRCLHEGCWDLAADKVQVLVNKVMGRPI